MFAERQNPSQTPLRSQLPQIDPIEGPNQISEELSWDLITNETTYNSVFSGSSKIAIPIDRFIVIMSDTFTKDQDSNYLIAFDTEKRTCQNLEVHIDQFQDIDKCTACYWKDGQIMVLSWKKDMTGASPEHRVYLGAIMISDNGEGGLRAMYRSILNNDAIRTKTDYHTIHIYKNKLYIVSKIDVAAGIFNRSQVVVSYMDLESFQQEIVAKMDFQVSIFPHFSYLFENKLHIYFRKEERYSKTSERIEVDLDSSKYQVHSEEGFFTLAEKRLQTQQIQENVYVFSQLNDYNTYRNLYIFNLKTQTWKEHQMDSNYCPHFKDKGIMTIINDRIFVFGSQYKNPTKFEIWSSPLAEKQSSSKTNTMPVEQSEADLAGFSSLIDQFTSQVPYSDVKFQVESEIIPGHKWWLVQKSKYFADMFSSRMTEPDTSSIFIPDVKASTFKVFLQWIYRDSVDLNPSLAIELLQQANKFGVPELKNLCENYLSENISVDNYAQIANTAESVGANSLREATVDFIAKNTKVLQKRSDFMNLSNNLLKDAIMKLALSTNQI